MPANLPPPPKPLNGAAPPSLDAVLAQAMALHQAGQPAQALPLYEQILRMQPGHADALHLSGIVALQSGQPARALERMDRAIQAFAGNAAFHSNRGLALQALGRAGEALASFDQALALQPAYAEAWYNRGNVLQILQRPDEALASYEQAVAVRPDYAEAWMNRGFVLKAGGQAEAALASFRQSVAVQPGFAAGWFNLGNLLYETRQYAAAVASYDRAATGLPGLASLHLSRGNGLFLLGQLEQAIASYDRCLAIDASSADAWANRGNALMESYQPDAAVASYSRALVLKPDYSYLQGTLLFARLKTCDWQGLDAAVNALLAGVARGERVSGAFPLLSVTPSAALQRRVAEVVVAHNYPPDPALGPAPVRPPSGRIRIGYFSADLRNHPVAYLTAEMFELHDRERFELFAFSWIPADGDPWRERLSRAFDHFIDVTDKTDLQVAQMARALGIDIAVDLGGHTTHNRTNVFALRAAPLQVSFIGYPASMGAPYIDYLIADDFVVPTASRHFYSEKIASLPCFQPNDRQRHIAEATPTRAALGLPDKAFVFCCFNNSYKILPDTFARWMRILQRALGSVLLLYADNPQAQRNLQTQAAASGISPERLVFGQRLAPADYLARYRCADLFLDTFPFNAGTTASDALWAGLPVLTLTGEAFASRMAGSLLRAIDLPELITGTPQAYEDLAVALAGDPPRMQAIRQRLAAGRAGARLFDTPFFTRQIESVFRQMIERQLGGLPPDHIAAH